MDNQDQDKLDAINKRLDDERLLLSVVALTAWPFDRIASEYYAWVERETIADPVAELKAQIERYKRTGNPAAFAFYSHEANE